MTFLFTLLAVVMAQDAPKGRPEDFPYTRGAPAGGIKIGEYQSLYLPRWILVIILIAFLGAMGFLVKKLLSTLNEKEQKKVEKKTKKADSKKKPSVKKVE